MTRLRLAAISAAAVLLGSTGYAVALAQTDPTSTDQAPPAAASVMPGCTLQLDGIDGDGPGGALDIQSWSWGATNAGSSGGGGGGGAGKVSIQDFHFMKTIDKSSPQLFLAVASGKHIKSAILTCRSRSQEYLAFSLSDVLISGYSVSSGGDRPSESLSLNFTKIEYKYTPQSADGSAGTPIKAGWDVKANKKV